MSMMTDNTHKILTPLLRYLNTHKRQATTFEIKQLLTDSGPQNKYCIECTRHGLKQAMGMLLDIDSSGRTLGFRASLTDVDEIIGLPSNESIEALTRKINEVGFRIISELDYNSIESETQIRSSVIELNESLSQVRRLTNELDKQLSELKSKKPESGWFY